MTKWKNHEDNKGFLNMEKKWNNMGVPRKKVGGTKTEIPYKRTKIKAK